MTQNMLESHMREEKILRKSEYELYFRALIPWDILEKQEAHGQISWGSIVFCWGFTVLTELLKDPRNSADKILQLHLTTILISHKVGKQSREKSLEMLLAVHVIMC